MNITTRYHFEIQYQDFFFSLEGLGYSLSNEVNKRQAKLSSFSLRVTEICDKYGAVIDNIWPGPVAGHCASYNDAWNCESDIRKTLRRRKIQELGNPLEKKETK